MRPAVISYFTTPYGEHWERSLHDLMSDALDGVINQSGLEFGDIDAFFVGNMLGSLTDQTLLLQGHIAEITHSSQPVFRIEAACASGGMAFQAATHYLAGHPNATVIVLGAEKMTDLSAEDITRALGTAAAEDEQYVGLTFPGLYALLAQRYLHTYGYTEEHLAAISVKNHAHGVLNKNAHFRRPIALDDVLESPYIAYPLKVLDSSPISDGASALIVSNNNSFISKRLSARVLAVESAVDTISLAKRSSLDGLRSTQIAGARALASAKLSQSDITIMEVHDCFSIAEILALEDLGFWKRGRGGALAKEMHTYRESGSNLIVNTSGGLKAAGHPVGGTGIKQIGEIYLQLTGQAESRQVSPHASVGLAHNVGGSGGAAVVTILGT